MNHIYKVVFNHALGAWVAVSELTKSYKKRASATAVAAALVAGLLSPFAQASGGTSDGENEPPEFDAAQPPSFTDPYVKDHTEDQPNYKFGLIVTDKDGNLKDKEFKNYDDDKQGESAISVEPNDSSNGLPKRTSSFLYLRENGGISIDQEGRSAKFSVNTGDGLTVNNDNKVVADTVELTVANGKVTAPEDDNKKKLVNAGDLSNALNKLGWKVSAGGATSTVKSGDEVEFKGDGVTVTNTTDETGKHIVTIKAEQPQGGTAGEKGADGKSAYDIWKAKDGNADKSEADFLASLKGDKGENGTNGTDGKSAYDIWKAKDGNADKSEADFLASLKGDKGENGTNGTDGKSAYDIWKAKDGNADKSEAEFLASLKGEKGEAGAVDTDGTTINVTGGKVSAVTGAIEKDAATGDAKAKTGDDNKLTTVANVANAINAAKVKVEAKDKTAEVEHDVATNTYKVAAKVADNKGLDKTTDGLAVKQGSGITVDASGVSVKAKDNGGIIVDKDGLSVDLPFTRTEEPDGTMVTFKGKLAADRPNGEVRIGGVAAGMVTPTSTDAVNGSQLYAVGSRVDRLQDKVDKLGKRADAGVAGALATANLLQPHHPGQSVATAAVGNHNGQTAIAVGYATMSDNGKYGMRFSFGANTQRDVSLGAGLGYFW